MSQVKHILSAGPLFVPARAVFRSLFRRKELAEAKRMREFYAQFFSPGDVVFDVGANQGEYAESFADDGAKVIAVEPNPRFRETLMRIAKFRTITTEFCAVSDAEGSATLNVCSVSGFSTLDSSVKEWSKGSPDYEGVEWTGQVTVPTVTLDMLAAKYAVPSFVKIDVEGFEYQVVRGMNFNPQFVSFEFGARRKEVALSCINDLGLRGYAFRPMTGREFRFDTPEWLSPSEAARWLKDYSVDRGEYGDMFARK